MIFYTFRRRSMCELEGKEYTCVPTDLILGWIYAIVGKFQNVSQIWKNIRDHVNWKKSAGLRKFPSYFETFQSMRTFFCRVFFGLLEGGGGGVIPVTRHFFDWHDPLNKFKFFIRIHMCFLLFTCSWINCIYINLMSCFFIWD